MTRGSRPNRMGSLTAVLAVVVVLAGGRAHAAPAFTRDGAPPASDDWSLRSAIGLDVGAGGTITDFNQSPGPDGTLFFAGIRGTLDLKRGFSALLALHQWWLPGPNHALLFGLGTRFEPVVAPWGLAFADLALGPASTGYDWCFGYEIGGGVEFNIPDAPGFSIGPYFRFADFINPDPRTSDDGLAWSLGASMTYHFGRAAAGARPAAGPPVRRGVWHISIPDTDNDGVADDEDECKTVPAGKHPDPFRPGCPENDEDRDGIPDVDDPCPVTPPGDHPDPKRPGCPFIDTDGDNISDADDACPTKAGPPTHDPSTNGCPQKNQPQAAPEPPPPDARDQDVAPKPVHKRHSSE
jgi:hypothetical protein